MKDKSNYIIFIILLLGIMAFGFVLAAPPVWVGDEVNYTTNEDSIYYHNLSANITGYNNDVTFAINTLQTNITWINASGVSEVTEFVVEPWIKIFDSLTGNLTINASTNSQTGFFSIPIEAKNTTTNQSATTIFEFIINATNDYPNFTSIDTEYNLTQNIPFTSYLNGTDEEEHYPLFFNISFFNNCTLASWSTRTNCSLLSLGSVSNTSSIMSLTPTYNDVGIYWANVTMNDFGENFSCPHSYCDDSAYQLNKTISSLIMFNVFSSLSINATDCQDKIFQENQEGTCQINITTKNDVSEVNISSNAQVSNYAATVQNQTWFYSGDVINSSGFLITIDINVTPLKTEVGNWTINLTSLDITNNESDSELIYVYVNRTNNDVPDLIDINNQNTSVNLLTRINLTVYDDDLLIPDKSSEGFNETINFNVTILNQSDLGQELPISGFDVEIISMPVSGTNRTEAKIEFTPVLSEAGDYTINITINDNDNTYDSDLFNLTIISNQFPVWNQSQYNFDIIVNSTLLTTENFGAINLTDGYITDPDGNTLTFSNDSNAFPRFSLTTDGIINFTPYKQDVGYWNFTVTATDTFGLINQTIFIFNVTNINSNPYIEIPISSVTNASVESSNSNITAQEDNYTKIKIWVQDDDIMVSSAKEIYYNESITLNLTITGNYSNLFTFVKTDAFPTSSFPNRTEFEAIFTPNQSEVGLYFITVNVSDINYSSDKLEFNLSIIDSNDAPELSNIENYSSAVNRNFYFDINATDEEDGNDSTGNLSYSYSFLTGEDIFNSTIFNSTSGVINITFNSSQSGIYQISISVNDTTGLTSSEIFWLKVYDSPNITYPLIGNIFNLAENQTDSLNFTTNHSIGDNLTYQFFINNILRYNVSSYGNNSNITWNFTPNYTDETYGNYVNLTLVVYPSSSELANNTLINQTLNWDLNISHANAPVSFSGHIGSVQASYDNDIEINLSSYFNDYDYYDVYYNQSVNFSVSSNNTNSSISWSVSNWVLTLSSSSVVSELLNITGNDSLSIATSNRFEVEFTSPTQTPTPSPVPSSGGGGGGGGTKIVSLKIIVPEPVSVNNIDRIIIPIALHNDGERDLFGINLSGHVAKDNVLRDDIKFSYNQSYFSLLRIGQREEIEMIVDVNTQDKGTFEISINASVESPEYNDWAKLYLTVKETNDSLEDRLIFTQEFLQENPECIELEELLDEARAYFENGDFLNTVIKIQESINGCKNAISQQARSKRKDPEEDPFYKYLLIASISVFILGIGYYSYQRMKLRKGLSHHFFNDKTPKVNMEVSSY